MYNTCKVLNTDKSHWAVLDKGTDLHSEGLKLFSWENSPGSVAHVFLIQNEYLFCKK